MQQHGANASNFSGSEGAEQGVLEKRGTKTLFLVGGIDGQTRQHHHRNWVRHVAPPF